MKKILIAIFTIFTFGFYAVYEQSNEPAWLIVNKSSSTTLYSQTNASSTLPNAKTRGKYADGEYIGHSANAFYGDIQVKATIRNGKIVDVFFLDFPQDRDTSLQINEQAIPTLTQEAIHAQSANIDTVSGATDTSLAFRESLAAALALAKN